MTTVTVFGTGALGCWMGGRLAACGLARVTMVGTWPEGRRAIARSGIRVLEPAAELRARPQVAALHDPLPPADFALVLVKSHQTASVAGPAARAVSPGGRIVTLQNGLGNLEVLAREGGARVRAGVVVAGARLLAPGEVRAVPGTVTLDAAGGDPAMAALCALLQRAGIEARLGDDIERELWRKVAVNCAINPVSALRRRPNGALLDDPHALEMMRAAALEVAAVAAARGLDLGDVAAAALDVARRTAGNRSSMLQDLDRGARTEIDALCGEVVREGRRRGVATPVNGTLWQRVRSLEECALAAGAAPAVRPA